ncbi:hypothetical protein [Arsenicicoccus dermatophilus]|uniref:hypothetical protein n=1 Tax=Arsenicicoccus dermatophilus TaxID=1076331 RepID=UPI003916D0CE
MPDGATRAEFAAGLHAALVRRGLPLARVQARLAAADHPVALSTLSQWQHGHRVPRSPRSLAVVAELERILETPPGALTVLAGLVSAGTADRVRQVVTYAGAFTHLVQELGATSYGALETLGTHDRVTLDAVGALRRRRTVTVLRATAPTDRHVIAHGMDPGGDVDKVTVRARSGCRLGRVLRDAEAGVVAAELHFDRWLGVGDTVVPEVQIDHTDVVPSTEFYRWSTTPVPLLVVEAHFDRALVPTTVQAYSRPRSDAPDTTSQELPIVGGDRVHLVRQPADPGVEGIRWTWPGR